MARVLSFLADFIDATISFVAHIAATPDRFSRQAAVMSDDPAARFLGRHPLDR